MQPNSKHSRTEAAQTNVIKALQERLATATRKYEEERSRLEERRSAYTSGPGKSYADMKESADELDRRIAEQNEAHEKAKAALADAMLSGGGRVTQEVKAALTQRRNAEDLIEQLAVLAQEMERTRKPVHVDASFAAKAYVQAYEAASQCWAEMNVLSALVECGERVARAMAVVPVDENFVPYRVRSSKNATFCADLMLKELGTLRIAFEEGRSDFQDAIGTIDLGALEYSEILSSVQAQALTREHRAGAR